MAFIPKTPLVLSVQYGYFWFNVSFEQDAIQFYVPIDRGSPLLDRLVVRLRIVRRIGTGSPCSLRVNHTVDRIHVR